MEENYIREFILITIEQKVKEMVKELVEALTLEERELYMEKHPETKANGFYTRKVATKYGEIENLKVPRVRKGNFRPCVLPERRKAFFNLGEITVLMFASRSKCKGCSQVSGDSLRDLLLSFQFKQVDRDSSRKNRILEEKKAFRKLLCDIF